VARRDKVARFILGLLESHDHERYATRLVLVNGELGMIILSSSGDAEHPPLAVRVCCLAIRDRQLVSIYDTVNPGKISAPSAGDGPERRRGQRNTPAVHSPHGAGRVARTPPQAHAKALIAAAQCRYSPVAPMVD
jgi:hypothetical protein